MKAWAIASCLLFYFGFVLIMKIVEKDNGDNWLGGLIIGILPLIVVVVCILALP